jgi:hypothetical protein
MHHFARRKEFAAAEIASRTDLASLIPSKMQKPGDGRAR